MVIRSFNYAEIAKKLCSLNAYPWKQKAVYPKLNNPEILPLVEC